MGIKESRCREVVSKNFLVTKRVKGLGIPATYMAYYYLIDILDLLVNNDVTIRSFSREIYPILAKKYNKSECTIERDIRNIINVFWENQLKDKLNSYWTKEKQPRCREFIWLVKNYLIEDFV